MNIDEIARIMILSGCLLIVLGWVTVAIIKAIKGTD